LIIKYCSTNKINPEFDEDIPFDDDIDCDAMEKKMMQVLDKEK